MTTPELHAEDLLDREARGALSTEERARLDSHLAVCSVCRFERRVRADFREEFESLRESAPAPRPAQGRWRLVGLLAASLLLAGVAGAEWARARQERLAAPANSSKQTAAPSAPAAKKARHRPPAAATASAPELAESALAPEATAPTSPSPPASSSRNEASAAGAERDPAPKSARPAAVSSTEVAPVATESAPTLFAQASAARERGDYADAVERYGDLIRVYPTSAEALTGRALLGRLLLDRGDPTGAISLFDAYLLSSETTLREEALLGRALALGKLGSHTQEAAAWHELLQAYPGSVHAARARTRLATLEAQ